MKILGKSSYESMREMDALDNQRTDEMRKDWPPGTIFTYLGRRAAVTRYESTYGRFSIPGGLFFDYVAEDGVIRNMRTGIGEYESFRRIAKRDCE